MVGGGRKGEEAEMRSGGAGVRSKGEILAGLRIRSFAHRSFAHFAEIK